MPDSRATEVEKSSAEYRCTFYYADDVVPPDVPGERAGQGWSSDRENAGLLIEEGVARTDLGRMTLEQRISGPAERAEWGIVHEWVRTTDGWRIA